MKNAELIQVLKKLNACSSAVAWVGQRALATAWEECERADWMLWLCVEMAGNKGWPTRKQVVFAACQCARIALKFVPGGEMRPLKAIEAAERWTRGKATVQEVITSYASSASSYASSAYFACAASTTYSASATQKEMCILVRKHLFVPSGTAHENGKED